MRKLAHTEGLSFKKNTLASGRDRPDLARKRLRRTAAKANKAAPQKPDVAHKRLRRTAHQGRVDPQHLGFIDETRAAVRDKIIPL